MSRQAPGSIIYKDPASVHDHTTGECSHVHRPLLCPELSQWPVSPGWWWQRYLSPRAAAIKMWLHPTTISPSRNPIKISHLVSTSTHHISTRQYRGTTALSSRVWNEAGLRSFQVNRRRCLLGHSPCWRRILGLSKLRYYAKWVPKHINKTWNWDANTKKLSTLLSDLCISVTGLLWGL